MLRRRAEVLSTAAYRTLRISVPTVADSLRGAVPREVSDARLAWWSRTLLADVGVKITLRGEEHFSPREPMLVMSNHQSLYDIPTLYQTVPPSLRMVSKVEIGWVPIWGRAMAAAGFVFIDRSNRAKAIESLKEARRRLEDGYTVWIAPEGTRSRDGAMLPFKKGGFVLAEEMNVPILPITIDGTWRILPAKTWELHEDLPVTVTVHPRIHPGEAGGRDALMERVRATIASALEG